MGGKIALWFALHFPERVQKLLIVDIAPVRYSHQFDGLIAALQRLPLASLQNRKQADVFLAADIPASDYRQFLLQNLVLVAGQYQWRIDLDIFKRAGPTITGFPDGAQTPPYSGKLLVIAGAQSDFVQPETFTPLFPHAQFAVIPQAGHWVHVAAPAAFMQVVQTYLAQA
jgi:pimeloyl-ACP methyl ester carboxylesterase